MARPKDPAPSCLFHKPTGKARVHLKQGTRYRDVYLGEYSSPESIDRYREVVAEYLGNDGEDPVELEAIPVADPGDWTIAELAVLYDDFASTHYVKDGEKTNDRYRAGIGPLVTLYGGTRQELRAEEAESPTGVHHPAGKRANGRIQRSGQSRQTG